MLAEFKTNLPAVTDQAATGPAKEIIDATQEKLGFVPNMYRTMANSPGYLSTYIHGYNEFRGNSGFNAKEQEIVFLVISRLNQCEYCVAAHSMIGDKMAKLDEDTLNAVRAGIQIADEKLQALAVFTAQVFETRGFVTKAQAAAFLDAGYGENQILEVVLAIAVKTLSNYSNHIFHTDLDAPFQPYAG